MIIVGDAFTNINILKKTNAAENDRDKLEANKFNLKKYVSNKINANVVGCFSMSKHLNSDNLDLIKNKTDTEGNPLGHSKEMTDAAKKMLCLLGFSQDGYIRMYSVKEEKRLSIIA